jgi:SAM-dependent MidA family methyltransferase
MLRQIIIDRIKREGPIPFKDFMEMALYYPHHGYYTSAETDIGSRGDFYTSPHVHPVFGALIGRQIEEMWRALEEPEEFHIIEAGAGKGYLAADLLAYLKDTAFFSTIRYTIVEMSPFMRQKQEQLLAPFIDRVCWTQALAETAGVRGCIVSNELLDAFPVHSVYRDGDTIKEIYVTVDGDGFVEEQRACSSGVAAYLEEFGIELPPGYRTEINLEPKNWLRDAGQALSEGFILSIDYGYPVWDYYGPARSRGTLVCYYKHQDSENPYEHVGMQDISAHVNFSAIKKWGEEAGFKTIGYCSQGTFLVSLGIDEVMKERFSSSEDSFAGPGNVSSLISPDGFGETHKVLAQYKGSGNPQLRGFSLRNRLNML